MRAVPAVYRRYRSEPHRVSSARYHYAVLIVVPVKKALTVSPGIRQ